MGEQNKPGSGSTGGNQPGSQQPGPGHQGQGQGQGQKPMNPNKPDDKDRKDPNQGGGKKASEEDAPPVDDAVREDLADDDESRVEAPAADERPSL